MKREPRYLADFVDVLSELGPAAFQVTYRQSMLIGTGLVGKILERAGGSSSRRTLGTSQSEELAFAQALMGRIWPIRKDLSAPPGPMITVGQSINNDITIAEYTLSTQHCGFAFDVNRITLTDLESMNGTVVNDVVLEPNKAKPLQNGDKLALGRLRFDYTTGRGFFERIYRMLHGSGSEPPEVQDEPLQPGG